MGMDGDMTNPVEIVRSVAIEHSADILFYSGGIDTDGEQELKQRVRRFSSSSNLLFILVTPGGSPDSAYRMIRCLHRQYDKITLLIPWICKSAGTLLALGADELVVSEDGELGPLDIQFSKPDELFEQTSGLTPNVAIKNLLDQAFKGLEKTFLELRTRSGLQITTKTAMDTAASFVTGLFRPLFEQLDPIRMAESRRSMKIATEYGTRITANRRCSNVKKDAITRLLQSYPSHGFVIDRDEAKELFENVREPTAHENLLAEILSGLITSGINGPKTSVELFPFSRYNESRGCDNHENTETHADKVDDAGADGSSSGEEAKGNDGDCPENRS